MHLFVRKLTSFPPTFFRPASAYNYVIPVDSKYRQSVASINAMYIVAGVIHLVNALQYIYAWFPLGFGLLSPVMIPEYLNVVGAGLYLVGAARYNAAMHNADITHSIHVIETIASLIEVFAAFGWTIVWWYTFVRGPGRGLTLDDPDFTGNALIVVPSIIYLVYNVNNLIDPNNYYTGPNAELYMTADLWYFIGSIVYVFSALRDDGWFPSFRIFGAAVFGALGVLEMCLGPRVGDFAEWLRGEEYARVQGIGKWERNHEDRDTTTAQM